jgi:hypothetical protein
MLAGMPSRTPWCKWPAERLPLAVNLLAAAIGLISQTLFIQGIERSPEAPQPAAAAPRASLQDLDDPGQFQKIFDNDRSNTRLVILVSPT